MLDKTFKLIGIFITQNLFSLENKAQLILKPMAFFICVQNYKLK